MLVAPHPDDESLACSIILQRAVAVGASVRIVYATDGDNNPWPQRALERKWRITSRDRERWGRLRRMEARAALRALGIARGHADFLGLPDQGLTRLLKCRGKATQSLFQHIIAAWKPTLLLGPSSDDTHPDHKTIGRLIHSLDNTLTDRLRSLAIWTYKVHGSRASFARKATVITATPAESRRKLAAIQCHKTQLALSKGRFLAYAKRSEQFRRIHPQSFVSDVRQRSLTFNSIESGVLLPTG